MPPKGDQSACKFHVSHRNSSVVLAVFYLSLCFPPFQHKTKIFPPFLSQQSFLQKPKQHYVNLRRGRGSLSRGDTAPGEEGEEEAQLCATEWENKGETIMTGEEWRITGLHCCQTSHQQWYLLILSILWASLQGSCGEMHFKSRIFAKVEIYVPV